MHVLTHFDIGLWIRLDGLLADGVKKHLKRTREEVEMETPFEVLLWKDLGCGGHDANTCRLANPFTRSPQNDAI